MNIFKIGYLLFIFSSILSSSVCGEADMKELRIIIIGQSGVGKSATGNSILGKYAFVSRTGRYSVKKTVQFEAVMRFGRRLLVVDTPGLYHFDRSDEETLTDVAQSLLLTYPGPHAFILVVKPGRFLDQYEDMLLQFEELFGPDFQKHLVVVFTDKHHFEKNDETIEEFVDIIPESRLKRLIRNANNRFLIMDYSAKKFHEQEKDVKLLLNMIDEMIRDNGTPYYETQYLEKLFADIISKLGKKKYMYSNFIDEARQIISDSFKMAMKELLSDSIKHASSFAFNEIITLIVESLSNCFSYLI